MDKGKTRQNKPGRLHLNLGESGENVQTPQPNQPGPGTPQPPPTIEPDPDRGDPKMQ
jgi:hypothetical protein